MRFRHKSLAVLAMLAAGIAAPGAARKASERSGELTLALSDPLVTATIAGRALRLRVDFDQRDVIELNPAIARALPIAFERGFDAQVGRVAVRGVAARAKIVLAGRAFEATVASHERDCCAGVDGAVGPDLLPFASIRFIRAGAPPASLRRSFTMVRSEESGLYIPLRTDHGSVFVQFSLSRPATVATAASGAILARAYGGRFVGPSLRIVGAFGVERPARMMVFARPAALAGFAVPQAQVRIGDFRGGFTLPADPAQAGDIAVTRRGPRAQFAWPAITIGRDQLDRCSEIAFRPETLEIDLVCEERAPST